jgi:predicted nucleic acid-binding protein
VWVPGAVTAELREGRRKGHDVPSPGEYPWISIVEPRAMPSEWLALDLGMGELAAMAVALENPVRVVLLDDALARRTALAAGLTVRGTLGILLDGKSHGLTDRVEPWIDKLEDAGLWVTTDVRRRILSLAGEPTA